MFFVSHLRDAMIKKRKPDTLSVSGVLLLVVIQKNKGESKGKKNDFVNIIAYGRKNVTLNVTLFIEKSFYIFGHDTILNTKIRKYSEEWRKTGLFIKKKGISNDHFLNTEKQNVNNTVKYR